MKIKTNFSRRFLLITFLIGFLFLKTNISYSQTSSCEPCPQLASYIASPNKADYFIKKTGYKPPPHLKLEWKKFPAVRKIEMAYEAFENRGHGENFLSKLSNEILEKNGAIEYETKLKSLIEGNYQDDLKYKHSTKYQKTSLPRSIREQVIAISKYTEAGAFGGVRGVLQYKLGLPEDKVYKILRESSSFIDAFNKGLDKARIPPSKQQRIVDLTRDLIKKYPSATYDKILTKFLNKNKVNINSLGSTKTSIKEVISKEKLKKAKVLRTSSIEKKYSVITSKYYPKKQTRKFSKMIKTMRGFGGVIFGNKIEDKTNLPDIDYIRFIPTDTIISNKIIGNLEFIFKDDTEFVEFGVYEEDVHAANELVFKNDIQGYVENEGFGLASIQGIPFELNYFDSEIPYSVLLHPVIAQLNLGWSALLVDALPITRSGIHNNLIRYKIEKKDSITLKKAFDNAIGRYKIVDTPMYVKIKENRIELLRSDIPDSLRVKNVFITMQSFKDNKDEKEKKSFENKDFYNAIPVLSNLIDEYHRVNQFAKIFALFRWAKNKEAKTIIPDHNNNLIESPELIFITPEKNIKYSSLKDNRLKFEKARSELLGKLEYYLRLSGEIYNRALFNQIDLKLSALWEYLLSGEVDTSFENETYKKLEFYFHVTELDKGELAEELLKKGYKLLVNKILGEFLILTDLIGIENQTYE